LVENFYVRPAVSLFESNHKSAFFFRFFKRLVDGLNAVQAVRCRNQLDFQSLGRSNQKFPNLRQGCSVQAVLDLVYQENACCRPRKRQTKDDYALCSVPQNFYRACLEPSLLPNVKKF
jgi:hypothetical protein